MKIIHIKQKLESIGVSLDSLVLGDFDTIGEFCAKRQRTPDDPNFKKYGAFYRANFERGILIYNLIRQFNLTSFLEIGFGRGYATFCAAKAFYDSGTQGRITTIDPQLNENYVKALQQIFPADWFKMIRFAKAPSQQVLPAITEQFDLVYIDGDHSYEATKHDWEQTKDKVTQMVLFDDYHLPTKEDKGTIECSKAIDEIDYQACGFQEPELLILDRRIFPDDRQFTDDQINYGQVLMTKLGAGRADW